MLQSSQSGKSRSRFIHAAKPGRAAMARPLHHFGELSRLLKVARALHSMRTRRRPLDAVFA